MSNDCSQLNGSKGTHLDRGRGSILLGVWPYGEPKLAAADHTLLEVFPHNLGLIQPH